ncbi:MAG: hypothetical protein WC569_00915, partial [Candidatus Omnitrophota bacterium]
MRFGINARLIKDRGRVFNPAVIGAVLFALMPMSVSSPLLIILLGAAIGMLLISVFAPEDFNFLFAVFLAGLAIRASLALLFYYLSFVFVGDYSPGFLFQNDGWPYSQQGWAISKFAERGIKVTMDTFMRDPNMRVWGSSGNITSYDFFASHVYGITGYSPVSLFFISGAAGSIACLFVYFIARRLFLSRGIARISACLAFFWPSFIMWSTQNLKEPMIAMFTLMALCAIFYMNGRFFFPFLCLCLGSLYVLSQINFPVFMIVIGSICFSALFLYLSRSMGSKKRALAVIFICGALVFIFLKDYALAVIFKKSSYDITSYKSMLSF